MLRWSVYGYLWACFTAFLPGQQAPTSPEPVRIGALFSLTGPNQDYGQANRNGVLLAVDEIQRTQGIRGRPVEIVWGDDTSQPRQALAIADRWIRERRVVAIIGGTTSEVAQPVAALCQRTSTIYVAPFATHPDITRNTTYVFRVSFSDVDQARVAATFARRELQAETVWVLRNASSTYSTYLSDAFRREFEAQGGRVEGVRVYDETTTDFKPVLLPLKEKAPERAFIYLPGHATDTVRIVWTLAQMGISAVLLGSDTWDAEVIFQKTGPNFRLGYYTTLYHSDLPGEKNQAFVRSYTQRFQKPPTADAEAAYDAVHILAAALRKASTWDADSLRQALLSIDYEGPAGRIRFRPSGDSDRDVVIIRIENGVPRLHRLFRR
jgi:branched-chain amino acid transport system substrate-binding protein